jgi:cytochrome P450
MPPTFDPSELQSHGPWARLRAWASDYLWLAYALSRVLPNFRLGRYVIVARRDDVEAVMANTQAFHVRSGKRLAELQQAPGNAAVSISGFGTDDPVRHQSAMTTMAAVLRLQDIAGAADIVRTFVQCELAPSSGTTDLGGLLLRATADFACKYFGLVANTDLCTLSLCCQAMVSYAFGYNKLDSPGGRVGRSAAAWVSDVVRRSIIAQHAAPDTATIIGKLLQNGIGDAVIESLVIVAMMAQVAVPAAASMQAMRFLLRRPDAMWAARAAALANDDVVLGRCLMEALRFNYIAPAQLRDCTLPPTVKDVVIGAGTWRRIRVRNGDIVAALLASAMFDGRRVPAPGKYNPERDAADNLIFGFGIHRCAGFAIGRMLLVQLLQPLLRRGVLQSTADRARVTYFDSFPAFFPVQLG